MKEIISLIVQEKLGMYSNIIILFIPKKDKVRGEASAPPLLFLINTNQVNMHHHEQHIFGRRPF